MADKDAMELLLDAAYQVSQGLHDMEAQGITLPRSTDDVWLKLTDAIERAEEAKKAEGQAAPGVADVERVFGSRHKPTYTVTNSTDAPSSAWDEYRAAMPVAVSSEKHSEAPTPRTDALSRKAARAGTIEAVGSELVALARQLELELAHWQRMYECAQNANAYRQDALEAPVSASGAQKAYEECERIATVFSDMPTVLKKITEAKERAIRALDGGAKREGKDG